MLLIGAAWLLAQVRDIGISTANTSRKLALKTQPRGVVVERIHPYSSSEPFRLQLEPPGRLSANLRGYISDQAYEPIPGIQFVTVIGGTGNATAAVPKWLASLNIFAVLWWLLELLAVIVTAIVWWLYVSRQRKAVRGFPIDPSSMGARRITQALQLIDSPPGSPGVLPPPSHSSDNPPALSQGRVDRS